MQVIATKSIHIIIQELMNLLDGKLFSPKSIHIIIQELMNLLDGKLFSPWENFLVNPFGSDVISPKQLCKCTSVQVLVEARAVVQ